MYQYLSVIVHDLDLMRPILAPDETDAPLVVDADAVLPLAVPFQGFELVPRRNPQVRQFGAAWSCSSLRRATRSMFRNRSTGRLWKSASVSEQANEWIMAHCVPYCGIRQAGRAAFGEVQTTRNPLFALSAQS